MGRIHEWSRSAAQRKEAALFHDRLEQYVRTFFEGSSVSYHKHLDYLITRLQTGSRAISREMPGLEMPTDRYTLEPRANFGNEW